MQEDNYKNRMELDNNTIFIDDIAESIFDKATAEFGETFQEATLITDSNDTLGLSVTETKSNSSACQHLIAAIKYLVDESYSEIFDLNIKRNECNDDEFPEDMADIEITLKWNKIRSK